MKLSDKLVKFVFFCSKLKTFLATEIKHFWEYSVKPFIEKVRKGVSSLWKEYVEEKYPTE